MALRDRSLKGNNPWWIHIFFLLNFSTFYYVIANGSVLHFVYFELVEDNIVLSQWLNVIYYWLLVHHCCWMSRKSHSRLICKGLFWNKPNNSQDSTCDKCFLLNFQTCSLRLCLKTCSRKRTYQRCFLIDSHFFITSSLQNTCGWTSMMELHCEYSERLKVVNYLRKKALS